MVTTAPPALCLSSPAVPPCCVPEAFAGAGPQVARRCSRNSSDSAEPLPSVAETRPGRDRGGEPLRHSCRPPCYRRRHRAGTSRTMSSHAAWGLRHERPAVEVAAVAVSQRMAVLRLELRLNNYTPLPHTYYN